MIKDKCNMGNFLKEIPQTGREENQTDDFNTKKQMIYIKKKILVILWGEPKGKNN